MTDATEDATAAAAFLAALLKEGVSDVSATALTTTYLLTRMFLRSQPESKPPWET